MRPHGLHQHDAGRAEEHGGALILGIDFEDLDELRGRGFHPGLRIEVVSVDVEGRHCNGLGLGGLYLSNVQFPSASTTLPNYIIQALTSGANNPFIDIEGGLVNCSAPNTSFHNAFDFWPAGRPTNYKVDIANCPYFNSSQSTFSANASGGGAVGNIAPTGNAGTFELGKSGSLLGELFLDGSTSGQVGIQAAATAGSWTLTLPTNAGSNNQVLTTDGTGIASWGNGNFSSTHTNTFQPQGNLVVGNNQSNWVIVPNLSTLVEADVAAQTAPTGQSAIFDIQYSTNGGSTFTSLWSSDPSDKPTLTPTSTTGSTNTFTATTLPKGALLRFDVDRVGSGTAGANATVTLVTSY